MRWSTITERRSRWSEVRAARDMPEPGKHTLTEQLPVQHREQADSPRPSAAAIPTSAPVPSAQSSIPLQMLFGARPALGDGAGGGNGHASRSDGGGKAMPAAVQAKMAHALGMDFSAVQIHEGPGAGALGARAYTQGNDVHFAPGEYQPGSQAGQMLLGHDLAHVVQQRQGRVQATTQAKGVAVNDDAGLEREATRWGRGRRAASERMPGPRQRPMAQCRAQHSGPRQGSCSGSNGTSGRTI
ncbi:MAG: DUF4157 domain-containing protein [Kofleriaceae bacterium]